MKNGLNKKPLKEATEDPALPICWKGARPFRSLLDVRQFFASLVLSFASGRKAVQMEIPPENYLIITVSISYHLFRFCAGKKNEEQLMTAVDFRNTATRAWAYSTGPKWD